MTDHCLNEKFTSMFRRKRRRDEDVFALSGLTKKFLKLMKRFSYDDLLKITEYYMSQVVYVIEYDITSILQNVVTKNILTNNDAKKIKAKEECEGRRGVESFIREIMQKDNVLLVSLWEALAEELVRFPSPNLTKILEEVTDGGLDLMKDIQASLKHPDIDTDIRGLYDKHKGNVFESTRNLEEQPSSVEPCTKAVGFETRYIELVVINQYKRTYNETQHELVKTGRTHAELVEQRTKEKCERIWTEQLFRRCSRGDILPKILLVSGVAGIGKTTMVQKIMYDWARGAQYQRFAFVFVFRFRELNLLDNENEPQMPLTRLIVRHYKYLNDPRLREILQKPESILFIFDGLDEYKHKLDFTHRRLCSNINDYCPVHILVTSLVSQTLLKGCSVLMTSRPTALESLNMKRFDRFAEILGFFHEQRLMYFKKYFVDTDLGSEAFQYVEDNTILYTMCFNPSYCWIICSGLKSHFTKPEEERGAAPRTVTELFVMFLHNILTNHRREAENQREILIKLGEMAYYGVDKRILVFYDKFEMSTFGLRPFLSSSFLSGFLKEILQIESTLDHTTYTFFHLTLQEFMAACFFYLDPSADIVKMLENLDSCKDGRFEIFTQFLAGLATTSAFETLGKILGALERRKAKQILDWMKQRAERALKGRQKSKRLQVCQWLCETQNKKLIRDAIGMDLKMDFSKTTLSPLDCAVLGSVINCCRELRELDLSNTSLTPECIKKLAPGLIFCKSVKLQSCGLTSECCDAVSFALAAKHSLLNELKLGSSKLDDSGMRLLCEGLRSKNCKLVKLSLSQCGLTSGCCSALSLALSIDHSYLTELELGWNKLEDAGVRLLCEGLKNKSCKLEKLCLRSCGLTSECCIHLSSALSVEHSSLIELELTNNKLEDSGVHLLCEGRKNLNGKLEKLRLNSCHLTSGCCEALSLALSAEHSQLTELQLNDNQLGDSGVLLLYEGLRNNNCKLEGLWVNDNGISEHEKRRLTSLEEELKRSGQRVTIYV
ncbi:NACHT, LRR and PYD domains-containing protein 3-like [Erpetoichthys calabaricus]|uniref:NACHT, LRR and PYD domains-containing protein 3-like n=1 Tax=Erpetoichthys calabaricus TaxID=27687 RepID=UPI0022340B90|nr:NACHT, LRR and PYD domains-containing protein 3-like [Erpetoichthys calabaricus]